MNHLDWSLVERLAKGDDIFLSLFSILIFIRFIVLSFVSILSLVLFELIFIWIFSGSLGLKGFLPLFIDWIRIGFVIIFVVVLLFSVLLSGDDIIKLIVGFAWVFWAESALYTSPSFIISFNVFWAFWFSFGLFWTPNIAEGISEFCWGINELLFFRKVSWVFWVLSNIELFIFLSGNKLMIFWPFLSALCSSILNSFCSKIDDCPWLWLLLFLLSNNIWVNMGSFFSSWCSSLFSFFISPGSNSISSFFSSFSSFFSGTYPNLISFSTNLISLLLFSLVLSPLKPKLTWTFVSKLLLLSFSFFVSIIILLLCSLDLSFESLIFELLLFNSGLFILLIIELLKPKVTLEESNIELYALFCSGAPKVTWLSAILLSLIFTLSLFSPFISLLLFMVISSTLFDIFPLLFFSLFSSKVSSFFVVVVVSFPFFITVFVVVTIFFVILVWGISSIIIFESLFNDVWTPKAFWYMESIVDIWSFIGWNIIFTWSIDSGENFFNSDEFLLISEFWFSGLGRASVTWIGDDSWFWEISGFIF